MNKHLPTLKEKIAKKLKIGVSRVRLKKELVKEYIKDKKLLYANSTARQFIKKGIVIKPEKRRGYRILKYRSKKEKRALIKQFIKNPKNENLRFSKLIKYKLKNQRPSKLIKNKTLTDKKRWIFQIRALRAFLKENKPLILQKGLNYGVLRKACKSSKYKRTSELSEIIK